GPEDLIVAPPRRSLFTILSAGLIAAILPAYLAAQRAQGGRPAAPGTQAGGGDRQGAQRYRPTVLQRVAANPALAQRLTAMLPPGLTLADAASGFRNEGQFIAALHAAHNLHIPFAQLKAQMDVTDRDGLGRAIQELRPDADAKEAVRTAELQAREDLQV